MSAPHLGHADIPGTVSFQTFERLLSLRAFETFLFGTAIDLHLLRQSFRQGVINLILLFLHFPFYCASLRVRDRASLYGFS